MDKRVLNAAGSLWAKKSSHNGRYCWLPLTIHLADTMAAADFLWHHWMSSGQRDGIIAQIQGGSEVLAERLVRFLAGVHDIGKATPVFQTQRGFADSLELDKALLEKLESAGFTGIGEFDSRNAHVTHHTLAGEVIVWKMGVKQDLASIIGAHHGMPIDHERLCQDQIDAYAVNYDQTEKPSAVSNLWHETQSYFFNWALQESELYEASALPEVSKPGQVLLSGLLIMADWIASNEAYFPLILLEETSVEDMTQRFQNGILRWYRDMPYEFENPHDSDALYQERFGFLPRDFQKVIFDTVQSIEKPGIVIIEAPTGSGKTETALAAAEQLAAKTGRSGLFFGLPTQATSNSMFARVYAWLESVSHTYGRSSIRLQHGKAALNPLMEKLSSQINVDEDASDTVIVNQWFAGRKTAALDDFVVGTVDQFLLLSLKQKHLALRHLGFDKKVVIIDEVHAYDAYMQQYLTESMKWMGAYGVPVILLSATLPKEKRQEFAMAYLQGTGLKKREIVQNQADLNTSHYPLVTYSDGPVIHQQTDFPVQKDKTVEIRRLDDDALYELLEESIRDGGVIGVIVNTVRRSQEIARNCVNKFGEDCVVLLHANFIATDRVQKETRLMRMIGKNGDRPKRLIVIGTQVIEQSLDIDFDMLITDLCPMDLLIQRIGRLHRHAIDRPLKHQRAAAYILGESESLEFDTGSVMVYGAYLLARTQYYLPHELKIPSSVSPLVQNVYGFQEMDPVNEGEQQTLYQKWKEEFNVLRYNRKQKARNYQIEDPELAIDPDWYNLIGWLNTPSESDSDEEAYAQVRDTKETVEVIAVRRYGEKYGLFAPADPADCEVSDHIADPSVAKKLAAQTLRLPSGVIQRIGISRLIQQLEAYNKRYLDSWQSQVWLRGSLGIIFDEDGIFRIEDSDIQLQYDSQYGLVVKREEET